MQCALGIDQGTTSTTALLVERGGGSDKLRVRRRETVEFAPIYPRPDWVEHDVDEIWQSLKQAVGRVLPQHQAEQPAPSCLGITNQRETVVFFDRFSLRPVHRAMVWQCKRGIAWCDAMRLAGHGPAVSEATGLCLDPYFSASKIAWALEYLPEVQELLRQRRLGVGTIDTYLIARLSRGASYVTDPSNASRTLLFNIHTLQWDLELMRRLGLEVLADALPEIVPSMGMLGECRVDFLPDGLPITGALGDQQAALLGHGAVEPGAAKCTYGTGAFLLAQSGANPVRSRHGLLTTVAWQQGDAVSYCLEGSVFVAGAAVQFLRDQLGFFDKSSDSAALAATVRAAPELYFVSALAGLGAPWWLPEVRGGILGLTRASGRNQVVRAALEGIAFRVHDLMTAMEAELGRPIPILEVDGGASANPVLLQFQADITQRIVRRSQIFDTTAVGAALAALCGQGAISDLGAIRSYVPCDEEFVPSAEFGDAHRQACLSGWRRAIAAVQTFGRCDAETL